MKQAAMKTTCILLLCVTSRVYSEPQPAQVKAVKKFTTSEFVRFTKKKNKESLKTAIVRYKNKDGVTVDLVAAIHVADKKYYTTLNRYFNSYDCVLYEMITDKGKPHKKKYSSDSRFNVSRLQNMLKTLLGLVHQIDYIHYSKSHFIHADVSMTEFDRLQKEYKTSLYTMMAKASRAYQQQASNTNAQTGQLTFTDILIFLMSDDSQREMKLWLAPQLSAMLAVLSGREKGIAPLIIIKRNQVALCKLTKNISKGKKKLAIFYGAAHMPHFERILIQKLGFSRVRSIWLTAWDMSRKSYK